MKKATAAPATGRAWATIAVALVTVVLLVVAAGGRLAAWLDEAPLAVAGLLGAVWLLALPAAWIGLAILIATLIAAAARRWRRRQWRRLTDRAIAAR